MMAEWKSWNEFTQETTMHGISIAYKKDSWIVRRVIWHILIVTTAFALVTSSSNIIEQFIQKKVSTKLTHRHPQELKMPTVTLCNQNIFSKERLEADADGEAISEVLRYRYQRRSKPNWADPKYNTSFFRNSTEALLRLNLIENRREDYIKECVVGGDAVDCDEVLDEVVTEAGRCYQFNKNGSLLTSVAGADGGAYFALQANLSDYSTGPFSMSEGFMYLLGESNSVPLMKEHGHYLPPGVAAKVGVQLTQFDRVPPYADAGAAVCFDTETIANPLRSFKSYTYNGCYMECKTLHVIKSCGCTDLHQPQIEGTNMCLMNEMMECAFEAEKTFQRNPEILAECDCRPTCKELQYTGSWSFSRFPSEYLVQALSSYNVGNRQPNEKDSKADGVTDVIKQAAAINIYYEEISYTLFEEYITYTLPDLAAKFGGTLGVTLGASLLTLAEFIEFILVKLFRKIFRGSKVNPAEVIHVNEAEEATS